jgi:membrane protein DedA with SNARE-associated domain
MDLMPLATLSGLLLVKEMGVPIPVPGDILVLGAGAATSGRAEGAVWLLAIVAAGSVGGTIQFLLVRGAMRKVLLALLTRLGVSQARLDGLAASLHSGGTRAIAIAHATPGVRAAAIAASGIAGMPLRDFLPGFVIGNTIFVGGHFALGFVMGKPALGVASELGSPAVLVAILVALSAVGALTWFVIRRRRPAGSAAGATNGRPPHTGHGAEEAGIAAWADAACPICLTLAAVRAVRAA